MSASHQTRSDLQPIQQELLEVLENTRSQLAVAVAAASKHMPPAGWRFYFETDRQARRCVRRLRERSSLAGDGYREALASLRRFNTSRKSDARQLCRTLQEILPLLEPAED